VALRVIAENAPIAPNLWMHGMIDLARATVIVDQALAQGRTLGLPPLTVAVLDAGGCLVAFKREDGSSLLRPEIAQAKAWGALGMGIGSRAIAQRASVAPAFVSAVNALAGGRVIPVPGGVLIRSSAKSIIGAVGITGATSDQDEACAVAGIESAGLTPDTGADPTAKQG
jgi:uncharacterized protein GlcG (DUF336 family)